MRGDTLRGAPFALLTSFLTLSALSLSVYSAQAAPSCGERLTQVLNALLAPPEQLLAEAKTLYLQMKNQTGQDFIQDSEWKIIEQTWTGNQQVEFSQFVQAFHRNWRLQMEPNEAFESALKERKALTPFLQTSTFTSEMFTRSGILPQVRAKTQRLGQGLKNFWRHPVYDKIPYPYLKLLRDLILHPNEEVAQAAADSLQELAQKEGFEGVREQIEALRKAPAPQRWAAFLQSYLQFTGGGAPIYRSHSKHWLAAIAVTGLQATLWPLDKLVWLLNPLPVDFYLYNAQVRKIYDKVFKNPNTELSPAERDLISKKQLTADLEIYRSTIQNQPLFLKGLRRSKRFFQRTAPKWASFLVFVSLIADASVRSSSDYIEAASRRDASVPRVELIHDMYAFPHTAIRIDDRIYSPGQKTVLVSTVREYLKPDLASPVPRSVSLVELKLSDEEVSALRERFEEIAWLNYYNETGVHDCATLVCTVLEKTLDLRLPPVVDASPSLTYTWLRADGFFGNPRIGKTTFVHLNPSPSWNQTLTARGLRALSGGAEAKIFYLSAPFIAAEQNRIRNEEQILGESEAFKKERETMKAGHRQAILNSENLSEVYRSQQINERKLVRLEAKLTEGKVTPQEYQTLRAQTLERMKENKGIAEQIVTEIYQHAHFALRSETSRTLQIDQQALRDAAADLIQEIQAWQIPKD